MRLTSFTDYTLRTLLYLGANRDRLVTIQDIADMHVISKNHLMKVVYQLGLSGIIETVRGRNGGMRLKREPADINIGALVRETETDFYMAECFDREHDTCRPKPSSISIHRARPARHARRDKRPFQRGLQAAQRLGRLGVDQAMQLEAI